MIDTVFKKCLLVLFFLVLLPSAGQAYNQPYLVDIYIIGELQFDTSPVYLTATALYSDGSTKDVTYSGTWKSSDLSIASVHRGKVEFGSNTGNLTISFSLANLTVEKGTEVIDLTEIDITPKQIKYSEKPVQLKAQGRYTDGILRDVSQHVRWYAINEDVVKVDRNGLVTFRGRAGKGFIGVVFTSPLTNKTLKDEILIEVSPSEVEKEPTTPTMAFTIKIDGELDSSKKTNTLKAYRLYIDDSKKNLSKDEVDWYSSNTNIATVDENGKVTFTGQPGKVKIYARDGRYSDRQASVEVTIPYEYVSLTINESLNYTPLFITQPPTLTVTAKDNSGHSQLVYGLEWSSSQPEIATIDNQGKIKFTGQPGTVNFTASKGNLKATAECHIPEDKAKIIQDIKITENLFYNPQGQKLTVLALYNDGSTTDITKESRWQSSNEKVATVYQGEVFFTGLPGQVQVTAQYQNFAASVNTLVRTSSTQPQLAAIKFQKQHLDYQDHNTTLKVLGLYTNNSNKPLNNVQFHSYQPNVAQVIQGRLVFTGRPGTALIEAAAGNFRDTVEINILGLQGTELPAYLQIIGDLDFYLSNKDLRAVAVFANGRRHDITQEAVWNTTNQNIAQIIDPGKVEVLDNGPYRISAAHQGQIAYLSNNAYYLFNKLHPLKTNLVDSEKLKKDFTDKLSQNTYRPPLVDISQHWAARDIQKAYTLGWLGGYPDGTMRPDQIMTRGEFASILERTLGLKTTSTSFTYLDTESHWARRSISTIANLGLVPLDGTRHYRPDEPLTRAEMAMIINNLIEVRADRYYPFLDVPPTHPAKTAIANLVQAKIMAGVDDLHFKPNEPATRAQVLTVVLRLLKTDPALLTILN